MAGKTTYFADATSRNPSRLDDVDSKEAEITAFNQASIAVTSRKAVTSADADEEYTFFFCKHAVYKHARLRLLKN